MNRVLFILARRARPGPRLSRGHTERDLPTDSEASIASRFQRVLSGLSRPDDLIAGGGIHRADAGRIQTLAAPPTVQRRIATLHGLTLAGTLSNETITGG